MATRVQWHGTRTEGLQLARALSRYCSCVFSASDLTLSLCAPHEMLRSEQRAIDGRLFSRRIAARLRNKEFHPCETTTEVVPGS